MSITKTRSLEKFSRPKKIVFDLIRFSVILFALQQLSKNASAIEREVKHALHERAGGRCESMLRKENGKLTLQRCPSTQKLEIAHRQHGDTKKHNSLDNLQLFCVRCHFLDHLHRSRNNISKEANNWTLYQLWQRMTPEERQGLPEPQIPKKNNHCKK